MAERRRHDKLPESEETETRETHPAFSREGFEQSPEFANFKEGMKKLLAVPKSTLNEHVKRAKEESSRRDNPLAPGRKKRTD